MPLYYASILQLDPMAKGWIVDSFSMNVAVICRREIGGRWLPLYGEYTSDRTVIDLPRCFKMDPLAEQALETVYIAERENQINDAR